MIKQTAEIFEILSKGQFISSNSVDEDLRRLYLVIDENFDELYDYFMAIRFFLTRGDEYVYFVRMESKVDMERKLRQAMKWIDILDFVKSFDNSFGSGFRFTPSDISVRLNLDAELKDKLIGLKKYTEKEKYDESIEKVMEILKKEGFVEEENTISRTYKVTAAFHYLEQLVLSINIPEEVKHEIPE
jgi:hypothetical protein